MDKISLFILISGLIIVSEANLQSHFSKNRVFDTELYQRVINSTECNRQLNHLRLWGVMLNARFLDAGLRLPRGIFMLVSADLGNYDQCLEIDEEVEDMKIEGKYALFTVPLNQSLKLPFFSQLNVNDETKMQLRSIIPNDQSVFNEVAPPNVDALTADAELTLGACMPKACSLDDWMKHIVVVLNIVGVEFREVFYRLPNDKPWVAADYVAIVIFSTLTLITVLSTLYDINHVVIKKQDPGKANKYYRIFSVYTNTSRLLTFKPNPNALDCLDGIRCISMMWVILGHVFQTYNFLANLTDTILYVTSVNAMFISTGLFTVDSFFMMAGLLLVYTTVGKLSGAQLLKRLHAFYLNRLLRMFPLLATLVLLEASVFHRIADGPYWNNVALNAADCRTYWWTTLLHIQNYFNPENICIKHSWYIAIDIQLHIISPLVLYWVLSKNKKAVWSALIIALLAILTGSTIFNFIKEFPSISASLVRMNEQTYYLSYYYMNTLCRGSAFFIGMITGYIIHIYKGIDLKLSKTFVTISWTIALLLIAFCFYSSYKIMQLDWDNQVADSLFNSFMRGIWSIGLSWIIFACVKGYGGVINWLFTLKLWKLPARISFAMYLYHFPVMFMYVGSQLQVPYFSPAGRMYDFVAFLMITFLMAFVVTLVIDAPFSILIKMVMEGGQKRPRAPNSSPKPGHLPSNDGSELENTHNKDKKFIITTLQKDPFIMGKDNFLEGNGFESNGKYLEKTGVPFERNGVIEETNGLFGDTDEVLRQTNEISSGQKRPRAPNSSPKPGHLPSNDGSELENTHNKDKKFIITTLQKDPFIMGKDNFLEGNGFESNGKYLEKTGVPFERNGVFGETNGISGDTDEVLRQTNEISTLTKDKQF